MSELQHETAPPAAEAVQPTLLLVDDEPNVLAGLSLHLRRHYRVLTAASGGAALAMFQHKSTTPAVVISDMNMPGMNGATVLSTVRLIDPSVIRILLTGQANVTSAIAAINDGQVFRFLTKPCPPALLLSTVEAAVAQHKLLTAERVLLQETLHGSIEALTEVLSLTNPVSFGWASNLKQLVGELATLLAMKDVWQLELAAMFSQLGHVTLPPETADKLYRGYDLSEAEREMIARLPAVTDRLLAHIPRLESVRDILRRAALLAEASHPTRHEADGELQAGAQLLDVARRFLQMVARGDSPENALALLQARLGTHSASLLGALKTLRCDGNVAASIQEVSLLQLRAGMILSEDLHVASGQLLARNGYVVTESFVERCLNAKPGTIVEPIRIAAQPPPSEAHS